MEMFSVKCCCAVLLVAVIAVAQGESEKRLLCSEDLVQAVVNDCTLGDESISTCMRQKVLSYMNNVLGVTEQSTGRQLSDESLDEQVAARVAKYVSTHDFQVQLPEFIFQGAVLTFRPSRGLENFKIDFPKHEMEARADDAVKMKMKLLMPIMMMMVGLKATKALIISKLSMLMVTGFLIYQLCQKLGMPMPMAMPAAIATEMPPPIYGPAPASPSPYGAPAPTVPDNSYGPWDSSSSSNGGSNGNGNGGSNSPYARWDAQNVAYSSYSPDGIKTKPS